MTALEIQTANTKSVKRVRADTEAILAHRRRSLATKTHAYDYWILVQKELHCCWCGTLLTVQQATIEHLHPRVRGGTMAISNLAPACRPCNSRRGSMPLGQWAQAVSMERGGLPGPTIVLLSAFHMANIEWGQANGLDLRTLNRIPTYNPVWGPPVDEPWPLNGGETVALELRRDGLTHQQAADQLGVCKGTIRRWLRSAREKLGADIPEHAITVAQEAGLLA